MSKEQIEEIIRNFISKVSCPSCLEDYQDDNIVLLGGVQNILMVQAECISCGSSMIATVFIQNSTTKKLEQYLDFDKRYLPLLVDDSEDGKKKANGNQITDQEVAEFREHIFKFKAPESSS